MKYCIMAALCAAGVFAAPPQGDFIASHAPSYLNGNEFPGATGSLEVVEGVLNLHYDFSGGGHYVGAGFHMPEGMVAKSVSLDAEFTADTAVTLRVVDSSDQCFQTCVGGAPSGRERLTVTIDDSWAVWGGRNDHVFHQPAKGFSVLAENLTKDRKGGAKGIMRIGRVVISDQAVYDDDLWKLPFKDAEFGELVRSAAASRDELQRTVPELESRGLGAKSRATLATLDDFLPWMLEDVARGFTNRAVREARELAALGKRGVERARRILAGEQPDFPVPHYRTSKIEISHAQMIADRQWPDGHVDRGPVFLTGYGHFSTIQRNLHQLPPLGNHVLQMEFGPWSVLDRDGSVLTNALENFREVAARAAKANVAIALLLSPHYFPNWELDRHPHLRDCAGGFLKYCVYAPEARALIERYLRVVIPAIRGNPALHSVCLSNEPESHVYAKCPELRKAWPQWLARRHGTVAAMNAKLKTQYASFDAVPMPANFKDNPPSPVLAEFREFNTQMFADWHRWMADIVHELAPELPVHSKIMINPCQWDANATFYSVDPALFAAFSQYNGNDSYDNFNATRAGWGWSHNWSQMEAGYDWQRSAADIPVFNTENHIQPDRSRGYLPGDHTYTVLWQNAIHGQSATTLWCWERAYDNGRSDFNGLILERPEAFEAWAHCALDLSRLADKLAPIQNLAPSVLVYWSPSAVLRAEMTSGSMSRCYRAASFLGQPLGFATDAMLTKLGRGERAERPLDRARTILVPDVKSVPAEIQAGLDRFAAGGGVVLKVDAVNERQLARQLAEAAKAWKLPDYPVARQPDSDLTAYGVETRGCRTGDRSYISLCNHLRVPVKVRLEADGVNLITGEPVTSNLTVQPLKPLFVELKR